MSLDAWVYWDWDITVSDVKEKYPLHYIKKIKEKLNILSKNRLQRAANWEKKRMSYVKKLISQFIAALQYIPPFLIVAFFL